MFIILFIAKRLTRLSDTCMISLKYLLQLFLNDSAKDIPSLTILLRVCNLLLNDCIDIDSDTILLIDCNLIFDSVMLIDSFTRLTHPLNNDSVIDNDSFLIRLIVSSVITSDILLNMLFWNT